MDEDRQSGTAPPQVGGRRAEYHDIEKERGFGRTLSVSGRGMLLFCIVVEAFTGLAAEKTCTDHLSEERMRTVF